MPKDLVYGILDADGNSLHPPVREAREMIEVHLGVRNMEKMEERKVIVTLSLDGSFSFIIQDDRGISLYEVQGNVFSMYGEREDEEPVIL